MSQNEVIENVHLFIGGPMDGKLRRFDIEGNKYLIVPEMRTSGRVHHVYKDAGYAMLYRGINKTVGLGDD